MILDFGYLCMEISTQISHFPTAEQDVITDSHTLFPSGKALTTAISAARMGAKVSLIGTIGNDLFGKAILDRLRREGISHSGIAISEHPTGIIQNIRTQNGENHRLLNIGANIQTNYNQIPDRLLNIRTLLLAQDNMNINDTHAVFKKAQDYNARTMLYSCTLPPSELLQNVDFLICPSPPNENFEGHFFQTPYQDQFKNEIFCGIIAACLQSNMPVHLSDSFAKNALDQTYSAKDPYPYLSHINENKPSQISA